MKFGIEQRTIRYMIYINVLIYMVISHLMLK